MLWHCWLGGRKGIRPVKNWAVGCWHRCLSSARCRLAYGPAANSSARYCIKLPTSSLFAVLPHHVLSPVMRSRQNHPVLSASLHQQALQISELFGSYNVMSMWSLRWHFTNKSVTGAPYSIKGYSYSLSHSRTLWWRVRWLKQCHLEVAAELIYRWTGK